VLEDATRKVVPPTKRFSVFDCEPVTRRALEVLALPPMPSLCVIFTAIFIVTLEEITRGCIGEKDNRRIL
jgi:hypothetical protein